MRLFVALAAAVVLFAVPASAHAQQILSGDSPTPWGYGSSPDGQYYQPTAAQSYQWASPYASASYYQPYTYQSYSYQPAYTSQPYTPPAWIRQQADSRPDPLRQLIEADRRADETRDIVRTELRWQQQFGWR